MSTTEHDIKIERVEEFALSAPAEQAVSELLRQAFPGYPAGRSFYKQRPSFRYLCWEGPRLIAQMGVCHRMIHNGGQLCEVFGISDLCVEVGRQRQQIGSALLEALAKLGEAHRIDFLVLLAAEHNLYLANGFRLVDHPCAWLMVSEDKSLGIARRAVRASLMVKPLGGQAWREGLVDFLGTVF